MGKVVVGKGECVYCNPVSLKEEKKRDRVKSFSIYSFFSLSRFSDTMKERKSE